MSDSISLRHVTLCTECLLNHQLMSSICTTFSYKKIKNAIKIWIIVRSADALDRQTTTEGKENMELVVTRDVYLFVCFCGSVFCIITYVYMFCWFADVSYSSNHTFDLNLTLNFWHFLNFAASCLWSPKLQLADDSGSGSAISDHCFKSTAKDFSLI